jgi:uncharacterized protein involved in exopolysaccharide biosynthesis
MFETILLVVAGLVGVVILGLVAVFFLGWMNWMDRGSH